MIYRPAVGAKVANEKELITALLSSRGAGIDAVDGFRLNDAVTATFTIAEDKVLTLNCTVVGILYGDKGEKPISVKVRASEGSRSALRVRFKELDAILD